MHSWTCGPSYVFVLWKYVVIFIISSGLCWRKWILHRYNFEFCNDNQWKKPDYIHRFIFRIQISGWQPLIAKNKPMSHLLTIFTLLNEKQKKTLEKDILLCHIPTTCYYRKTLIDRSICKIVVLGKYIHIQIYF